MSFTGTSEEFLEQILRLPRVVAESVSPDLRHVAFSWANVGESVDAWVTPVDGATAPTRITDNPDDSYVIGWTPDGAAGVCGWSG